MALVLRALVRPSLAFDLVRMGWRFRHRRWYYRFPFLPIPARSYVRWRMYTAYGSEDAMPTVNEIITYARWLGRQP